MKKFIKLPSISRVVPGATATLEMPLGATYERLIFTVSAAAGLDLTDIGRVRVLIDGKEIQTFKDLTRLTDINAYYGRDADTVSATQIQFAIHFNRAELLDNTWRKAPGIGTDDVQTFHIELDIVAAAPADIAMVCHAVINPAKQPLGAFFRIREFAANSSVAGVLEADKLPRGAWYSVIHLFKSDITAVEVTANDVKIIDATKSVLERIQKGAAVKARVPVTGKATHIDLITEGDLLDSLPTANLQDFRIKMTLGTSGAVDIITETIDTL